MYTFENILNGIEGEYRIIGEPISASGFCSIFEPIDNGITWSRYDGDVLLKLIEGTTLSVIIAPYSAEFVAAGSGCTFILTSNPHLSFVRLVKYFMKELASFPSIHASAIVDPRASIGKDVSIGPFSIVGNAVIEDEVVIGSHVNIHDGSEIGNRVKIYEYCNIGSEGFGHIITENGTYENQHHIGRTIICDDVEIFPFSNIDKATLGSTVIGAGTMIDRYCHISHNCKIGENSLITAGAILAGGAKIGSHCFVGIGARIRDQIVIGDGAVIGMAASVTKNVPAGETWVGSPAEELGQFSQRRKRMVSGSL